MLDDIYYTKLFITMMAYDMLNSRPADGAAQKAAPPWLYCPPCL